MICKACGHKGEDRDFLRSGYYVCPKCSSLDIKIEKAGPSPAPPKNGNQAKQAKAAEPKRALDDFNPKSPPEISPSGKPASAYGEILVRVWMTGPKDDPAASAEVAIAGEPDMPFPFWMVGCEHLMTATAQKSKAGFEKALELLVEGAMTTQGKLVKK